MEYKFNLRSTTTAMHRLVNSSITVSMRNFLPSCVRSMTKSSPDVIGPARPQTDAGSVVEPQPAPFRLLLWDLQPLPPPDALDPLGVHCQPSVLRQGSDPPIAISAILAGQADDRGRECLFIIPRGLLRWVERCWPAQHRHVARRFPVRPGDDQHTAGDGRGLAISLKRLSDQLIQRYQIAFRRRPFSFSRSFRRLAWSVRRPPYSLRQR